MWCPTYRCPAFGGRVKDRFKELIRAEAGEHGWEVVALASRPPRWRRAWRITARCTTPRWSTAAPRTPRRG
ncbi:hypothetical protein [Nonomuraea salmonea]|uniref:hypothetical protein n=1 Tax=Nonomuraea salmonea TaxID=46181 RepID=UPI0031E5B979